MGYIRCNYAFYNYDSLSQITTIKRAGKRKSETFNNCIIMLDTETSKKSKKDGYSNHICAFTISIRAKHENICTLWGNKPSQCIECLNLIFNALQGDNTIIYVHNLAYDYVFLRKFLFKAYGYPKRALNTKSHYPIMIEFNNGLILKDSLILAQKSLEKWANDMDVEHKKSVGKWDYDKIRNQDERFSLDELEYIEHDTLAGVECIDKLQTELHHYIYAMPYTATGIVRDEARKIANKNRGHDRFTKLCPSYEVYLLMEMCFHGGYTHGNRYLINEVMRGLIQCFDFTSSYPYVMLTEKFPMTKFYKFRDCSIDELIASSDTYAFMTKLILYKPRIRDNSVVMPILQSSKCLKTINAVIDNGRILCAGYVEIVVDEQTLKLIKEQYVWDKHLCIDVYYSRKDYLPKWFTDYIFELFKKKSTLKGVDPLNYMIAKGKLNSCYGMCVQKAIQNNINEDYDTGEYTESNKYNEDEYQKYVNNRSKFLPYQWGVWVTAYAQTNLHHLGSMCETWIYSDTDSVYGMGWDMEKVNAYNDECLKKLKNRGYDAIEYKGKKYILGVATLDGEYTEFKCLGAKRYCCRADDGLHITVAGVPKKGADALNDDINNFAKGFIFSGAQTGKKQHSYIYTDEIFIDENGNETGDSIDLSPCDYLLDDVNAPDWEEIFREEITIQVYE